MPLTPSRTTKRSKPRTTSGLREEASSSGSNMTAGLRLAKRFQLFAQTQNGLLGAFVARKIIPLGTSHGAEQPGVAAAAEGEGFPGKRFPRRVIGRTAAKPFLERETRAEASARRFQHRARLRHNFLADAVARQNGYLVTAHRKIPFYCASLSKFVTYGRRAATSSTRGRFPRKLASMSHVPAKKAALRVSWMSMGITRSP